SAPGNLVWNNNANSLKNKLQITAQAMQSSGLSADVSTQVTWLISDPSIAFLNKSGEISGLKNGFVNVTAVTNTGIRSNTLQFEVKEFELVAIDLKFGNNNVKRHDNLETVTNAKGQIFVTASFNDGPDMDITTSAVFTLPKYFGVNAVSVDKSTSPVELIILDKTNTVIVSRDSTDGVDLRGTPPGSLVAEYSYLGKTLRDSGTIDIKQGVLFINGYTMWETSNTSPDSNRGLISPASQNRYADSEARCNSTYYPGGKSNFYTSNYGLTRGEGPLAWIGGDYAIRKQYAGTSELNANSITQSSWKSNHRWYNDGDFDNTRNTSRVWYFDPITDGITWENVNESNNVVLSWICVSSDGLHHPTVGFD
ncbi:Ig-like domain-containing protein, partial [Shewanella sp.]|uniref:Ig-like domain-containing protein n=1 Tax=Shewanella sp. TaxID=50422 RepID=UPI000E8C7BAB